MDVKRFNFDPTKRKNPQCASEVSEDKSINIRSEVKENQTDKTGKTSTKKGRRKRKRAKLKRENSNETPVLVSGENSYLNSNRTSYGLNASHLNLEKGIFSKSNKSVNYKTSKRDKLNNSCSNRTITNMSWLDCDLEYSDVNDEDDDLNDTTSIIEKMRLKNKSNVDSKESVNTGDCAKTKKFDFNSKVSWLDSYVRDDGECKSLESVFTMDDNSNGKNNVVKYSNNTTDYQSPNLNQYRQRFFSASEIDSANDRINRNHNDKQSWNNEKVVNMELDMKIGKNVNEWDRDDPNRKKDKYDGTKRSRRKTEIFDFANQADGELEKMQLTKSLSEYNQAPYASGDIPSGLCNFMADSNGNSPKNFQSKNLLSGSISGKGLFVPFSKTTEKFCKENVYEEERRTSLERIFNEEYLDDFEDIKIESNINSEDDLSESDEDNESWSRGILDPLPPEPQLGNVEYKLKLVNPTKQRFEHLVTQMKWRLREGQGEALYEIGVRDCGRVQGLAPTEMRASLHTLRRMSACLGAECTLLGYRRLDTRRALAEVLVRKVPDDQHNIEIRVAVMGANDAGKSTLIGVLTQGELDNGRGSARLNMFRHLHEVKTGRTSSVSHEILGFDSQGTPVNYAYSELMTSEEINERSSKLISFIDLAGHRKYLKTTVQGLTGYSPHYAMLVVSATTGINQMTLEHLALVVALNLSFFVVITKIDATSLDQCIKQLEEELKSIGCRKVPIVISNNDDAVTAVSNASTRTVPVLPVSSVTGKGLDILRWFLFLIPQTPTSAKLEQESIEFQVDETFKIDDTDGPVVGGLLKKGVLTEKTKLLIGPLNTGDFVPINVSSLHRNKAPCRVVRAGQAASLRLSWLPPGLRQGMFLLAVPDKYNEDEKLQDLTNMIKRNMNLNKKEKQAMRQTDQVNLRTSPKFLKKNKQKNDNQQNIQSNNDSSKDINIAYDIGKNKRIPLCDDDIKKIVDDLNGKSTNETCIKVNLQNDASDTSDKIARLSPSRYSSRFFSVTSNPIDTISNISPDESEEDSASSESDTVKENESCTCVNENKEKVDDKCGSLIEESDIPKGSYVFQARVSLLNSSAPISKGCQCTVHIGNIRQTAVIEGILSTNGVLRAHDKEASVVFRFLRHPEYVRFGARVLFREALHTKGVGQITQVFPHKDISYTRCKKHKLSQCLN